MPTYQPYSPDQAELLPAHVKDVLGADHLCFVVHEEPQRVLADCGFFSNRNLREMPERGIEAYVPDANLARELNPGGRARGVGRMTVSDPLRKRARRRLRSARGRVWYKKRKSMVEPVFGTLKQQRGMRQFERRGKTAVAVEWTLASIAYNLTRYRSLRRRT